MKFIAHDHYNNNSYPIGEFRHPQLSSVFTESDVTVTDSGVTFFLLRKYWHTAEKIGFLSALNRKLKEKFSNGLDAVICALSDCAETRQFGHLYKGAKEAASSITTIEIGRSPHEPHAEHIIENTFGNLKDNILAIVKPTAADKAQPAAGWAQYEDALRTIYAEAQTEAEKALGHLFHGPRPSKEGYRPPRLTM